MNKKIVCIGEILWDSMSLGLFLGGAPFNVAYHLNKLTEDVAFISKVGTDLLGEEAIRRVKASGLSTDLIQIDDKLHTGFVKVELTGIGIPEYQIIENVAWDNIQLTDAVKTIIKNAKVIVFGTLAQRSEVSRNTIQSMVSSRCIKVLDLNLRPPYDNQKIVDKSLKMANAVKMNEDELNQLIQWYRLPAEPKETAGKICEMFNLDFISVTRGSDGAFIWQNGEWYENDGSKVKVIDTVGSGDAFMAVLVAGYMQNLDPLSILDYATRLGAYVATQHGGTPEYSIETIIGYQNALNEK